MTKKRRLMSIFRIDRLLSLFIVGPYRRVISADNSETLPILMYHSVSDDSENGVRPYYKLATSPSRFDEQMNWLAEHGYQGVSVEEALLRSGGAFGTSRRPVAITFDDGFRDYYTDAWPVLRRYGFTATMYSATGLLGDAGGGFRGKRCLDWDEIRELRSHGTRFGSHSVNHPTLHVQTWACIRNEVWESKQRLEHELGERVESFAYPFSYPQGNPYFTRRFELLLRECGYTSNVTTKVGLVRRGDDPMSLRRLPINQEDDRDLFLAKLAGNYDWLRWPQRGFNIAFSVSAYFSRNKSDYQCSDNPSS